MSEWLGHDLHPEPLCPHQQFTLSCQIALTYYEQRHVAWWNGNWLWHHTSLWCSGDNNQSAPACERKSDPIIWWCRGCTGAARMPDSGCEHYLEMADLAVTHAACVWAQKRISSVPVQIVSIRAQNKQPRKLIRLEISLNGTFASAKTVKISVKLKTLVCK